MRRKWKEVETKRQKEIKKSSGEEGFVVYVSLLMKDSSPQQLQRMHFFPTLRGLLTADDLIRYLGVHMMPTLTQHSTPTTNTVTTPKLFSPPTVRSGQTPGNTSVSIGTFKIPCGAASHQWGIEVWSRGNTNTARGDGLPSI